MSGKSPAFQFYPKQWLGDDLVMLMDWDARAMHMHYMCIAWQQTPACTLPNDDEMLRKWVGNPADWDRIKKQVFRAWKLEGDRWIQAGLLKEFVKQKGFSESRSKAAGARWGKSKKEKPDAYGLHMQSISNALQSSSSSSSSDRGKKDAPPSPASSEPDEIPEGLDSLQYARGVLEHCNIPHDYGTQRAAAAAIDAHAKEHSIPKHKATGELIAIARSAIASGATVNRFWFLDGKYRTPIAKAYSQATVGINPTPQSNTEMLEDIRKRVQAGEEVGRLERQWLEREDRSQAWLHNLDAKIQGRAGCGRLQHSRIHSPRG